MNAAAIEKKISGTKLGYIAMVYAISKPFSTFWDGCIKTTLPSFSIAPKIRTSEIIPAIFFLGKLFPLITYTIYDKKKCIEQIKKDFINYKNFKIQKSYLISGQSMMLLV